MNMAEAVAFSALVIGIICVAGVWLDGYKRRLTNRERELELKVRMAEAEARRGAGELPALEQRLRVLERIATDKGSTLAAEIEDLREGAGNR
jgi:hypothetical protein